MGCLKSIFKKILIIALIFAFFAFGGYAFVKDKIKQYQYPPRDNFVKTEKDYADFSKVSADYQMRRSFNLFGYKKVYAFYSPTEQKIAIYDLKDEDLISVSDFYTGEINEKIETILNKTKDSIITYENFKITSNGKYYAANKTIPYIKYETEVKNLPLKELTGVVAAYSSEDKNQKTSTKLIVYVTNKKSFNSHLFEHFIRCLY